MNVTLISFSQTGNTLKISNALSESFQKAGHIVKSQNMQKIKAEDLLTSDLLGIGSPTFECTAPTPVKEFINSLPKLETQKAFVFATGGGASGNVLNDLKKLLKKKGAHVIGGFLAHGEVHHPAPCLIGKTSNRPNTDDLDKAENFASAISEYMGNYTDANSYVSKIKELNQKIGFYNLIGLIGSSNKIIRLLEPKPKNNQDICKQCNLCVRECPVNNISINPFPELNKNCIRCYRCLNTCPQKAFYVNWRFGNIVLYAIYNVIFMRWFGEYEK